MTFKSLVILVVLSVTFLFVSISIIHGGSTKNAIINTVVNIQPYLKPFEEELRNCSNNTEYVKFTPGNMGDILCDMRIREIKSNYFLKRFNKEINPDWTIDNLLVNVTSYKWWYSLQYSPTSDMIEVMTRIFNTGISKHGQNFKGKGVGVDLKQCSRCAVVGSSSNLREHCRGKMIDDHDIVIRFNSAPTQGWEQFVGSKTTHRVAYPESVPETLGNGTSLILLAIKTKDIEWLASALTDGSYQFSSYKAAPVTIDVKPENVTIIHPDFIKYVHDNWNEGKGRYPSTGMMGIMYALHKCDVVNVFGFGADSNGDWQHYYETYRKGAVKEGVIIHSVSGEHDVIDKMKAEKIIKVYT